MRSFGVPVQDAAQDEVGQRHHVLEGEHRQASHRPRCALHVGVAGVQQGLAAGAVHPVDREGKVQLRRELPHGIVVRVVPHLVGEGSGQEDRYGALLHHRPSHLGDHLIQELARHHGGVLQALRRGAAVLVGPVVERAAHGRVHVGLAVVGGGDGGVGGQAHLDVPPLVRHVQEAAFGAPPVLVGAGELLLQELGRPVAITADGNLPVRVLEDSPAMHLVHPRAQVVAVLADHVLVPDVRRFVEVRVRVDYLEALMHFVTSPGVCRAVPLGRSRFRK